MSTNSPAISLAPPHGLDQIIATFGDIFAYIIADHTLDPRWQSEFLDRIALPFPMTLSWDHSQLCKRDHMPQAAGERFYHCVRSHSKQRTAEQNHQLRRMLLISAATDGNQAVYARLGNRH